MKKLFTNLAVLFFFALCGCNTIVVDPGSPVDKDFQIAGDYEALYVSSAFDVYVDADATAVTITAGENIISKVVVEQVDGALKIYFKPPVVNINGGELKAVIPYSLALHEVSLSGASSFNSSYPVIGKNVKIDLSGASRFKGDITGSDTEMKLSGASNIKGIVAAGDLKLDLSGASVADLTGLTVNLDLALSGSSRNVDNIVLKCYALECTKCKGSISGASKAYIHCIDNINVSLSGASSLHYTGDAATSGSSTSGASSIVHDTF